MSPPTRIRLRWLSYGLEDALDASLLDDWRKHFVGAPDDVFTHTLTRADLDVGQAALGLRLRGSALDIGEWVQGEDGLTNLGEPEELDKPASAFGAIGELLTWRHYQALGCPIIRVRGAKWSGTGGSQPRPDFVVLDGGLVRLVEVKSGDALNINADTSHAHRPCMRARERMKSGLRQIGADPAMRDAIGAKLALLDGCEASWMPGDVASVVTVLFTDGRWRQDALAERLRKQVGQGWCRDRHKCEGCLTRRDKPIDATLVRFDNEPGLVPLRPTNGLGERLFTALGELESARWVDEPAQAEPAEAAWRSLAKEWLTKWSEGRERAPDSETERDDPLLQGVTWHVRRGLGGRRRPFRADTGDVLSVEGFRHSVSASRDDDRARYAVGTLSVVDGSGQPRTLGVSYRSSGGWLRVRGRPVEPAARHVADERAAGLLLESFVRSAGSALGSDVHRQLRLGAIESRSGFEQDVVIGWAATVEPRSVNAEDPQWVRALAEGRPGHRVVLLPDGRIELNVRWAPRYVR